VFVANGPFDVGKELTHRTRHLPSAKMMLSPVYINIQDNNLIHHVLSGRLIATRIGNGNDQFDFGFVMAGSNSVSTRHARRIPKALYSKEHAIKHPNAFLIMF
jgi:hypothetical protein